MFTVLRGVWGKKSGYVFIPRRDPIGKKWDEGRAFKYPEELGAIEARVIKSVEEGFDVYWCPLVFSSPYRKKDHVLPQQEYLWADLDLVNPHTLSIRPSIAWRSSDEKYQALWRLDEVYPTEEVEELNRQLTYAVGADKGGWDVTQVLRVPGTVNLKYTPPQKVTLLWEETRSYSPEHIISLIGAPPSPEPTIEDLLKGYPVSDRVWAILNAPVEVGIRSDRLWEVETLLVEAGVPILTIVRVIKQSAWNKFKGRNDENGQIYRETLKADEHVKSKGLDPNADKYKDDMWAIPFGQFMTMKLPPPEWLVEGIWQVGTYGMLAGEPKTYKSVLATDLALSVASGKPFLGRFPVLKPGAVLFVQEENNPQTVQDRIIKIAVQKQMAVRTPTGYELAEDISIFFSNNFGIDLTDKTSRVLLEKTIKDLQPALVLFDPFYMMLGSANENDATEMRNTLHWLSMLRNKYGVAILVLHHYNKGSGNKTRGGQKIRGTSEFHAWVESALYVKTTNTPGSIRIEREFRSFPLLEQLDVVIEIGEPGEPYYKPTVLRTIDIKPDIKKDEIIGLLATSPRSFEELKAACKLTRIELTYYLKELIHTKTITAKAGGGRGRITTYVLISGGEYVDDLC